MPNPDKSTFHHDAPLKTGVLITNLGTPDAPDKASVRRYLKEFLWDPRVVETPRPIWWLILNAIILNTRPARSAEAYAKVWTEQGSPLLDISRRQVKAVEQAFENDQLVFELGMRYGNPSIASALQKLQQAGIQRLLVLPLYPQYSATTTASTFDAVSAELKRWRWMPELRMITHYHDHPAYINALADSVRAYQKEHGQADRLLYSFHGIPQDYFHKGDPYHCECHKTARLITEALNLNSSEAQLSFQSRLGPKQWLRPYTDETLKSLPEQGVKHVQVLCPGFSADCLETLEEVAMENRDYFLESGGERYEYIPCLNDSPGHTAFLKTLIEQHLQGWSLEDQPTLRMQNASAQGAAR